MLEITANDLFELATSALEGQGFDSAAARSIAEEFVVADIAGVKTHGVGKLVSLNYGDLSAEPKITNNGALISVDGDGGNGFVLFNRVANMLIDKCSTTGVALALVHNFSRYSSLYPYTSLVARSGYIGLLSNSAGPAAVAPYGSMTPLTGTNPICFSFPLPHGELQTFDFATSEVVWGAIRQASMEGRTLPNGPFFNSAGDVTVVPSEVNAVRAFGGAKGGALNLAIEILAGILSGGRVGNECNSEFDCGALFLVINPNATTTGLRSFSDSLGRLLESVRACKPENSENPVRVPGDHGRNNLSISRDGERAVSVPTTVIEMMQRMSRGEKVSELASNPLFN